MVISNAGFVILEEYPFLGASPDGCVCDPYALESYGLVEVKFPCKYHGYAPTDASLNADFFCELVTQSSGDQKVPLKKKPFILLSGTRSNGDHRESLV